MKSTLLEMVQAILSAMDSDEANSITDGVESNQVALLLKNLYYDIAVEINLPEHETLFELEASGDSTKPVLMTLPDNVAEVKFIKYNNKISTETHQNYKPVCLESFQSFLDRTQSLREESTGVASMDVSMNNETFDFLHRTDTMPAFYTVVDDHQLIFDAYDNTEDTTLQKSKTMCLATVYPVFTLTDTFVPDLDVSQFPYFLNRAKVRAFAELKQTQNSEAAGEARKQKIVLQKRKQRSEVPNPLALAPNYGRK